MDDRLYNFLLKLPRANLVHLMWLTLDEMQHYNGQSRTSAIAKALYAKPEGEHGWKLPTIKKAKEITENLGL